MPKLLVVEDEPTLRALLTQNLTQEGYEVVAAGDGEAGLAMARAHTPDLCVLDVMLPLLDGLSLCRILRKESGVPIILLTARGTEMDKVIGLETGADDYVVKPFGMAELTARVRAALRRTSRAPADAIAFGDVRIELAAWPSSA
jgi:DNA-binding response OmpR family regulator